MNATKIVNWIAEIQYPGKQPIWFGTYTCDLDTPSHEVLQGMHAAIEGCLPAGFKVLGLRRGQVWVSYE